MKKSMVSLITVGLLFSSGSATWAHPSKQKKVEYVALGDSIPAGMTPYGNYDESYPDMLKDMFQRSNTKLKDYDNFSVSGYSSEQLKDDVENNSTIRNELREATHITITIGANDLFQKLLSDPSTAQQGIDAASSNLNDILQMIDELNPKANVYVMGYYNPFAYYPKEVQNFLVPLSDTLNHEIEVRAIENGDTYVPTAYVIDPEFEKYMPNPEDNHLNVKGYKVIAKEFWKVMKKDR
ncbi:bacillolysin [Fictibacillus halophilus]|uniref:Bacillolysin n=1 Tax=Fictibacillus halophilus TaxID=1610490 RepID=A0ABV2LKM0_9BACL|nr:GDSL-type esterase/lipase family protein [Fictibacillus halophilus]